MHKLNIIVFGNTIFTKSILELLYKTGKYNLYSWVSNNDKRNPVTEFSRQNNIKTYFPYEGKKEIERFEDINSIKPDLCIVVAYGKIISKKFLELPKNGFLNIHGSKLPDLRGATPIQSALLKGYKKTGVSIQKMVFDLDAGDILAEYDIEIDEQDNFETLRDKMISKTTQNFDYIVEEYIKGKIHLTSQNTNLVTYCSIADFSRANGNINWNDTAINIHNKIRAFYPEPKAWSFIVLQNKSKTLNFNSSKLTDISSLEKEGTLIYRDKKLFISTQDKDLEITSLTLEGKSPMSGTQFGNGYLQSKKIILSI